LHQLYYLQNDKSINDTQMDKHSSPNTTPDKGSLETQAGQTRLFTPNKSKEAETTEQGKTTLLVQCKPN
jgi:hypothetical protein